MNRCPSNNMNDCIHYAYVMVMYSTYILCLFVSVICRVRFLHLFWPWERRFHTYLWSMTKKGHQKFWVEKINFFFPKEIVQKFFGSKSLRKTQGKVSAHTLAGQRSHTYFFSKRPLVICCLSWLM